VTTWPRRFVDNGWLWRGPGVVAAIILALTSVVAVVQQQEAFRRRDLVFAAQAGQLRQEVLEAIDRQGERFRTAVDFVAVTHPGPVDQFRAYFDRQVLDSGQELRSSFNFILLEQVATSGFDALRQREERLGNEGFEVRSLPGPSADRLVITRTASEAAAGELDVTGLDVTGFERYLPVAVPDQGYALRVLEPGPSIRLLLQVAGQGGQEAESAIGETGTFVMLVSPVPGRDGATEPDRRLASAVRLLPVDELIGAVDPALVDGMQASLLVESEAEPVATLVGPSGVPDGPVDLRVDYDLITDGQRWTLVIAAGPGYGPPTGLFDRLGTWIFGLTTATLAALALMARGWHGRRLVRTELELASALTVASTDGLTGLLNRIGFVQRSSQLDDGTAATVLFIDLDGFKAVNDLDGHEAGDLVLQGVAERLTQSTRPSDLVSRLGGDEFIVYLSRSADPVVAADMASRLIDAVDQVDDRLSCSIGVALRDPGDGTPVDELLRRADAAMYRVKRSGGRGFHIARPGAPLPAPVDGGRRPGRLAGPDRDEGGDRPGGGPEARTGTSQVFH
jgi:diguanylate cyclase (GGDEF)-like protein